MICYFVIIFLLKCSEHLGQIYILLVLLVCQNNYDWPQSRRLMIVANLSQNSRSATKCFFANKILKYLMFDGTIEMFKAWFYSVASCLVDKFLSRHGLHWLKDFPKEIFFHRIRNLERSWSSVFLSLALFFGNLPSLVDVASDRFTVAKFVQGNA